MAPVARNKASAVCIRLHQWWGSRCM
jgi:hypothetical protein